MIQMMTGYTEEIDEIDGGIAEVLEHIDFELLRKNSVGIITCHPDFTRSEFTAKLCEKLPFDVIGITTMASANQYGMSMYALTLTVLTSDDVVFETTVSEPMDAGNYYEKIKDVYSKAVEKLPGPPAMILAFFPVIQDVSGAIMHKSFDEICGGIPLWGSLTADVELNWNKCFVFYNSEAHKNKLAMILMHGPVAPEFVMVSLPSQNIRENRGQITSADGCLLKEIDGISPRKYFEDFGIILMNNVPVVTPLILYYEGDSKPITVGVYSISDDGSFLCGNEMPVGASIAIGEITSEGIISTTTEAMDRIIKTGKRGGALLMPCIARYVMLAPNHNEEMSLVINKLENGHIMPFLVNYSGGELCPVPDNTGVLRNRFHNHTFIACVF